LPESSPAATGAETRDGPALKKTPFHVGSTTITPKKNAAAADGETFVLRSTKSVEIQLRLVARGLFYHSADLQLADAGSTPAGIPGLTLTAAPQRSFTTAGRGGATSSSSSVLENGKLSSALFDEVDEGNSDRDEADGDEEDMMESDPEFEATAGSEGVLFGFESTPPDTAAEGETGPGGEALRRAAEAPPDARVSRVK
jgi:hypothetical protein